MTTTSRSHSDRTDLFHGLFLLLAGGDGHPRVARHDRVRPAFRARSRAARDGSRPSMQGRRRSVRPARRTGTAGSCRLSAICEWPTRARSVVNSSGSPASEEKQPRLIRARRARRACFRPRHARRDVSQDVARRLWPSDGITAQRRVRPTTRSRARWPAARRHPRTTAATARRDAPASPVPNRRDRQHRCSPRRVRSG